MKKFQKGLSAAVLLLLLCLTGCGVRETKQEGDRLQVVTTVFPYYDFTRQIAGEDVELTMVVPAGMDSHSFEPTPADMRLIQNADVLICNGGAMEHWLLEVLEAIDTSEMTVVTMMDYVDTVEEEMVEGMEEGHGHGDHDHEAFELDEDGHREEIEYDEHIWTSPVNAMRMVGVIAETLTERDPDHGAMYQAGAAAYLEELERLDKEFREVRDSAVHDMIVMGDKFPLRYFADTYGLRYRAAFSGCSSDTEPSARTIAYLIDKVKEEGLPVIYYLELSSHRVAEIIGEETGAVPLLFHSCHNVTRRQFEEGVTYLELMEQNVKNLREGLCK